MALSHPNVHGALTARLVEAGAFAGDPLTVVAVGCAYGIETQWRQFPLRVRAIDPMLGEIERLRSLEGDPCIEYVSGFVRQPGHPSTEERETGGDYTSFARSSAFKVASATSYNAWQDTRLSSRSVTLDELVCDLGGVDFLKTDTDGGDLEVLHSGACTLRGVLGVSVEAPIASSTHPLSNSRSNIDRLLRTHGLSMFDEETHRYSRAALPDRFAYALPGTTRRGQVIWSQCLYLRDLAHDGAEWPDGAFRKLACLFETYHLNDCAIELIQSRPAAFEPYVCVTEALDVLTREWWPEYETYAALIAAFDADPTKFYPVPASG